MSRSQYWTSMVCDNEASQKACLSWFSDLIPADWGLPLKADILEDPMTGAAKQLRAIFRLPDGTLKQALRRFNKRNTVIELKPAPSEAGDMRGKETGK